MSVITIKQCKWIECASGNVVDGGGYMRVLRDGLSGGVILEQRTDCWDGADL